MYHYPNHYHTANPVLLKHVCSGAVNVQKCTCVIVYAFLSSIILDLVDFWININIRLIQILNVGLYVISNLIQWIFKINEQIAIYISTKYHIIPTVQVLGKVLLTYEKELIPNNGCKVVPYFQYNNSKLTNTVTVTVTIFLLNNSSTINSAIT